MTVDQRSRVTVDQNQMKLPDPMGSKIITVDYSVKAPDWFSEIVSRATDEFCLYEARAVPPEELALFFSGDWLISQYNLYAQKLNSEAPVKKRFYCHGVFALSKHLSDEAYTRKFFNFQNDNHSEAADVSLFLEMFFDSISRGNDEDFKKILRGIESQTIFVEEFLPLLEPEIFTDFDLVEIEDALGTVEFIKVEYAWLHAGRNGFSDLSLESKLAIFGGGEK